MNKKVLLSSIATIALCLCLVAGSTFALFTYSTDVNVAVTAGNVSVSATIDEASLEAESIGVPATKDANGVLHFANGGTATLNGANLELVNITPGDFVKLTVKGSDYSNIAIKYRYVVKFTEGTALASAITVKVNGEECTLSQDSTYYASQWLSPDAATGIGSVEISVGMAETVGNTDADGNSYHEKTAEIAVVLEAVQGNARIDANGNFITD